MLTEFLRSPAKTASTALPRGIVAIWSLALFFFLIGAAFTILMTETLRLVPAVAVATVLAGAVASLSVLFSPR